MTLPCLLAQIFYLMCACCSKVRLKEYGSELIEIADNGTGVEPANHQSLTLKYYTSKLQQFSDLQVHT